MTTTLQELGRLIAEMGEAATRRFQALESQADAIERAVALALAPPGGDGPNRSRGPFANVGEQLIDVARATMPGGSRSDRLMKVQAAASGANEGIPSEGGFAVQPDIADTLNRNTIATGILSSRCFRMPLTTTANGIKLNLLDESSRANGSRQGGIQVYWAAEAATVTATKPKLRRAELELHKLFGIMYTTDELLQDAPALTAAVNRWFPREFGFKVDDAIIRGTGAGMPLGILNSDCLVSVAKESGQVADTLLWENVIKMYSRLLDSSDATAVWLINRDILPQLMGMFIAVGTGGIPVYMPANGAAGQPFGTLLGKPVIPIEQCSTLGEKADIILFDGQEYMLADKGGIQQAVSIHVEFLTDQAVFRWTYRVDGQPIRNLPLTPYQGTATRSGFVTLDAR